MHRYIATALLAALGTAAVFAYLVLPKARESWHQQGVNDGKILAQWQVASELKNAFPGAAACQYESTIFEVKTRSVQIVQCPNGRSVHVVD
jgi:hypothetical protein